jgi:quercetin dioxygenase-like cupin family protein
MIYHLRYRNDGGAVDYVRQIDIEGLRAAKERTLIRLLGRESGATGCAVSVVKTPPSGGSPAGLHVHAVDQIFYVIEGVMNVEIAGEVTECGPGSLVLFPAGTPHRNWNTGEEQTIHMTIAAPIPDPDEPFARPVDGGSDPTRKE